MVDKFIINGKEIQMIPATDRGIQFGDGCFTTATVSHGKISLLSAHIKRLSNTCKKLNIKFIHQVELVSEMQQLAYNQEKAVLNVLITRGTGKRGYSAISCTTPTRIIRISQWSSHYNYWQKNGIVLDISPIRLGRNPYLAGLKHLNRLEQVLIHTYLEKTEADELLVLDSEGLVTECCTANIFWRKNNIVYTPKLDYAGVNGIMRQFCISKLANSAFHVIEVHAHEEELIGADEIIICNSLMLIVPVRIYRRIKFSSRKLFDFLFPLCQNFSTAEY